MAHRDKMGVQLPVPEIVGTSPALRQAVAVALRAASGSAKVLITGESGVGKDLFARLIHTRSRRAAQPFVALNCAGIAESLLESELFGHVKGSFTGAYRDKIGCLEQAHGGTVFLDEIGDMGPRMQAMLLRFLETGELRKVGSDAPTRVNVRVISATNRALHDMVATGEFRDDLLYRIDVVHLRVPPLRERVEDIRPLIEHFVAVNGASVVFDDQSLQLLERYRWPGNIRELQNVVEQLASLSTGRPVGPDDLPRSIMAGRLGHRVVRDERRRSVAQELLEGLTTGGISFWTDVYRLFTDRDLTRADLREIIRRGLAASAGSYRGLLQLFGMEQRDYKRLLNFLAAHDCTVDAREFRLSQAARPPAASSAVGSSTPR